MQDTGRLPTTCMRHELLYKVQNDNTSIIVCLEPSPKGRKALNRKNAS